MRLFCQNTTKRSTSRHKAHAVFPAVLFFGLFLTPSIAFAEDATGVLDTLIDMLGMVIPVLTGLSVVVFFWGLVRFIAHADDQKAVTEGKQFIVWGLVGIFVIVALWSIVGLLQSELGIGGGGGGVVPSFPTSLPVGLQST